MIDWKPIETAPKDGSFVWAATKSNLCRHTDISIFNFPYPMRLKFIQGKWVDKNEVSYDPQPSHWTNEEPPFLPQIFNRKSLLRIES